MDKIIYFFSFSDPNIQNVVLGSVLLTLSCALVGCFTFLRKRALVGDAIAHSILPGVCLGFIVSGTKDPLFILIGAFLTGWLSIYLMDFIVKNSKIKEDTALAFTLSFFFSVGILLLTYIQHAGYASQSGLDSFLFGKAASIIDKDLWIFGITSCLIILTFTFLFKEFTLISFDPNFAKTIGLPFKRLELVFTTCTVLAVVVGIQAVGVVLMAAMLITPAAAARFWTNNLRKMVFIAIVLSCFSGVTGAFISSIAPAMPTGPWIVMTISGIAVFSFVFAPGKGIIARWHLQRLNQTKIREENILKALFQISEKDNEFSKPRSVLSILEKREIPQKELLAGLKRLKSQGYLKKIGEMWALTEEGKNQGQRITRLHRLWEMYLNQYLDIAPDHVHEDAESIEHILTPELENKIKQQLNYPKVDPHDSRIPYKE